MPRPRIYATRAAQQAAYRERLHQRRKAAKDEWETPQDLFDKWHQQYHFTLDVAALPHNAKCDRFYTPREDGLKHPWEGVCWLNPPYSKILPWIQKADISAQAGATVACLLPLRPDAQWWQQYVRHYAEAVLLDDRLRFGGAKYNALFSSALVLFHPHRRPSLRYA